MTARDQVEWALAEAYARNDMDTAERLAQELDALDEAHPLVPLGRAALWYAEVGLPVFPLQPLSKIPHRGTRGVKEATTDPARIEAWWTAQEDSNIGLATGHLVDVLDFDGMDQAHAEWTKAFGPTWAGAGVHPLATVNTPRPGGLHIYVKATGDGNRAGVVPGVDYRGRGGYVLAPPSRLDTRNGQHPGRYSFLRRLDPKDLQ